MEKRNCQNCKKEFRIEPEDFNFYEKIKVPPPTFCPQCRLQRRIAFFNLTNLYRRKCDLCGEEKISMYAPEAPYTVYCPQCWWGDGWDPLAYGTEYDFSKPFFEQFKAQWRGIPLIGLSIDLKTTQESPFNNHAADLKNCYLLFNAESNEDCGYGIIVIHNKLVFDCSLVMFSELSYDCMNLFKSSRCIGTRGNITESLDCAFLRDSDNCQNCFASANLRNKKHYIFNEPYSKEEYFKKLKQWDLGSYRMFQKLKQEAEEHWKKFPPRPKYDDFSTDYSGSYVFQSKNCHECYEVSGAQDCKFMFYATRSPLKDCYDISSWGGNLTLAYEGCVVGDNASNIRFCQESGLNLFNAEYCKLSTGGANHFACVSVKKGDYVIFNKRYSETEFNHLRERIINHMHEMPYTDKEGHVYRYGEFFPSEFSPFAYNETVAQRFFPLSEKEIKERKWQWRDPEIRTHDVTTRAADIPDHIKDAPDGILNEIIGCATCPRGFRIISMELSFLRKMNLPLPRRCPWCRISEKFDAWVNNLRVIPRTCGRCGAAFTTNHSKEEADYILCKKCYLEETV